MDIRTHRLDRASRQEKESVLKVHMLADSVRAAGQFQRSALGHMDHEHWLARVRTDGQKLIDLLAQMGFSPSEDTRKSDASTYKLGPLAPSPLYPKRKN